MSALHELLAAKDDITNQLTSIRKETQGVFGKPELFRGAVKTLAMTKEMDGATKKAMEDAAFSVHTMTTTVDERLEYHRQFVVRKIDFEAQKEATNQEAKADIVLEGTTLAKDVPVQMLLTLENIVKEQRDIYAAAPTLQPGVEWVVDPNAAKKGTWVAKNTVVTTKTEKTFTHKVLVAATDKHPAQIEKWNVDEVVGTFNEERSSGMWSSAKKADILAKCEKLMLAIKEARARANKTEVKSVKIADSLLRYVEG